MMLNHKFHTPLRYPGGKGRFAPFVRELMEINNVNGHYMEPYAGGAGVALDLLFNSYCSNVHINDLDHAIYCFWISITQETEAFLKLVVDTTVTLDQWERQKFILANPKQFDRLQYGFATFFLNRTNRSGILKGGVVGGRGQAGKYKLDARFQKPDLIRRIERIGRHADHIHVYNEDALQLLARVDDFLPQNSLIYLDPPYYVKGQGLYRNFYQHEDHVAIRRALDTVKTRWIVSYDNCDEIKEIYLGYRQDEYFLNYSAYNKIKGSEVMIYSDKINISQGVLLGKTA